MLVSCLIKAASLTDKPTHVVDTREKNRAGMVLFNKEVKEVIPLQQYSQAQWFRQVEGIRSDTENCCSCCTPTGDAFFLSRQIFNRVPRGNAYRIVFTITDGAPWQSKLPCILRLFRSCPANNRADTNGRFSFPGSKMTASSPRNTLVW